jgi:predicted hydrocarbon binding protein
MATKNRAVARKRTTKRPGTRRAAGKTGRMSRGNARAIPVSLAARDDAALSYEEAVIKNILQSSPEAQKVPREALLFGSLLSVMTPSTKELYYKSGVQIGRSLYKFDAAQKSYMIPEEAVEDLEAFFEKSGYDNVTYSALAGGKISMEFHGAKGDSAQAHLGTRMHVFESGIISGFLTAARGQLINIEESACAGAGDGSCRFVEVPAPAYSGKSGDSGSMDMLAEIVRQKSGLPYTDTGSGIDKGYHSLLYTPLLGKEYSEYIGQIASYFGGKVGASIMEGRGRKGGERAKRAVEQAIGLLNMGTAKVKSIKPLDMRISFDELESRQGFVDISLSFVNGLLSSGIASGKAAATESLRDGRYTVEIRN